MVMVLCLLGNSATSASFSISDFSRDKVVFDVGAAFGRDSATVPVGGTADPGTQIEVRVVNDATGQVGDWQSAGPAASDGTWQGSVSIGADADWYRVEARVATAPQQNAQTQNRFGGGDVVGYLGQSELARLTHPFFDKTTGPSVSASDQVQLTTGGGNGEVRHTFINDTDGSTAAMQALAQFWIDNAPEGRKVNFVNLAQSGTSHLDLADDSRTRRSFDDLKSTVEAVRADGSDVGLVVESWFAADAGIGEDWDEAFTGFYTGLDSTGAPVATGAPTGKGASVDNFLWDLSGADRGLFDEDKTKLGIFGPHRFDANGDQPQQSAILTEDGKQLFQLRNIERARGGVQEFLASGPVGVISTDMALPVPLDYANGYIDENGDWTDRSHPSGVSPDGLQRFAKHMGSATLLALGHVSYETPRFDLVRWSEDYVEVGSTGGRITTARIERGLEALDDTFDHWTDVLGFEIDGLPAERAEITADGFVRIFALDGQKFNKNTVIEYGAGGANGFLSPTDDFLAQAYLDIPIVDVGLVGLEGVAVLPTPGTYAIPNTFDQAPAPIPVPGAGLLGVSGLVVLGGMRVFRRRMSA